MTFKIKFSASLMLIAMLSQITVHAATLSKLKTSDQLDEIVNTFKEDSNVRDFITSNFEFAFAIKRVEIADRSVLAAMLENIVQGNNTDKYAEVYGNDFVNAMHKHLLEDSTVRRNFLNCYGSLLSELNSGQLAYIWDNYLEYYYDNLNTGILPEVAGPNCTNYDIGISLVTGTI
jgi:hypothetical protein